MLVDERHTGTLSSTGPGILSAQPGRHDPAYVVSDFARWPSALRELLSADFPRPARRTAQRREQGCTGTHFSPLMAAPRPWESPAEAALCLLGDVSPAWWGYWCQMLAVPYVHEGKARTAYPDFLVRLADGSFLLLEVKPASVHARDRARLDAVNRACAARGLLYKVVEDRWLHAQPRLGNAAALHAAWSVLVSDELVEHVRQMVTREQPETLAELTASTSMKGVRRGAALACALRGAFHIDIENGNLGDSSRVYGARPGTDRFLVGHGGRSAADAAGRGSIAAGR